MNSILCGRVHQVAWMVAFICWLGVATAEKDWWVVLQNLRFRNKRPVPKTMNENHSISLSVNERKWKTFNSVRRSSKDIETFRETLVRLEWWRCCDFCQWNKSMKFTSVRTVKISILIEMLYVRHWSEKRNDSNDNYDETRDKKALFQRSIAADWDVRLQVNFPFQRMSFGDIKYDTILQWKVIARPNARIRQPHCWLIYITDFPIEIIFDSGEWKSIIYSLLHHKSPLKTVAVAFARRRCLINYKKSQLWPTLDV